MYKSLDLLPIVIYYRIINSGDLHLLNPKNEEISQEELFILWDSLHNEFQDLDDNHLSKKILMLMKNYDYYILKYEIVNRSVEALRFSYNDYLISILKKNGFRVTKSNYLNDLEKVENDSQGLLIKAKHFKSQLPKPDNSENEEKASIEDILASYSTVLGFHIGSYLKITCREFISLKKQVTIKVKQQEKQLRELKNRKK